MERSRTDRRREPRRSEEAALHYARENLLAAALYLYDHPKGDGAHAFDDAVRTYRSAEHRARQAVAS